MIVGAQAVVNASVLGHLVKAAQLWDGRLVAGLQVEGGREEGHVDGPEVLERAGHTEARAARRDEVSITEAPSVVGDDPSPAELPDGHYHLGVGEEDELGQIVEEGEEKGVEDDYLGV